MFYTLVDYSHKDNRSFRRAYDHSQMIVKHVANTHDAHWLFAKTPEFSAHWKIGERSRWFYDKRFHQMNDWNWYTTRRCMYLIQIWKILTILLPKWYISNRNEMKIRVCRNTSKSGSIKGKGASKNIPLLPYWYMLMINSIIPGSPFRDITLPEIRLNDIRLVLS